MARTRIWTTEAKIIFGLIILITIMFLLLGGCPLIREITIRSLPTP